MRAVLVGMMVTSAAAQPGLPSVNSMLPKAALTIRAHPQPPWCTHPHASVQTPPPSPNWKAHIVHPDYKYENRFSDIPCPIPALASAALAMAIAAVCGAPQHACPPICATPVPAEGLGLVYDSGPGRYPDIYRAWTWCHPQIKGRCPNANIAVDASWTRPGAPVAGAARTVPHVAGNRPRTMQYDQ